VLLLPSAVLAQSLHRLARPDGPTAWSVQVPDTALVFTGQVSAVGPSAAVRGEHGSRATPGDRDPQARLPVRQFPRGIGCERVQRRVEQHGRAQKVPVAQQQVERDERTEAVADDHCSGGVQPAQHRGRILRLLRHGRAQVRLRCATPVVPAPRVGDHARAAARGRDLLGERREREVVARETVDQQDRGAGSMLRVRQVDARSGDDLGHGYD